MPILAPKTAYYLMKYWTVEGSKGKPQRVKTHTNPQTNKK